ncbi:hypothetical protein GCM10009819_03440 [Agromyces tropicus]|uniref:Uncharacterized protein n=1 Tax=Agromyces tropicus TaxID=555371 RepID=A0ABP5FDD0_9MICO
MVGNDIDPAITGESPEERGTGAQASGPSVEPDGTSPSQLKNERLRHRRGKRGGTAEGFDEPAVLVDR